MLRTIRSAGRWGLGSLHIAPGKTYRPASPMYGEVESDVRGRRLCAMEHLMAVKGDMTALVERWREVIRSLKR